MTRTADVVICGAGIAGVCAAYWLAARAGIRNVVLVDELAPLTLTSDKSTEAYRNWWPGPDDSMISFMNRNIDLLEEFADASDNRFLMNRRGYLYTTADRGKIDRFVEDAERAEQQGAGDVRVYRSVQDAECYRPSAHVGFRDHPIGADLFLDREAIRTHFPFLSHDIVAVLHARRCGWFSGQQLGMYLLEEAKAAGASVVSGRIDSVLQEAGRISGVRIATANCATQSIATNVFINAAGPYAKHVSSQCGVDLPVFSEMHLKIGFEDELGIVDRNTGLVILDDAQTLDWSDDERDELAASDETRWLTEPMPAGVHLRPEGYHNSATVLMLWDYHSAHRFDEPVFPLPEDPFYPEVVIRGLTRLVPGLAPYVDRLPHCYVDGGYYTKTVENRPLIGPTEVEGAYISAGFSGFGMMAAPAAGELVAAHITGSSLPAYESAFRLSRYEDAGYRELLASWGSTGQL